MAKTIHNARFTYQEFLDLVLADGIECKSRLRGDGGNDWYGYKSWDELKEFANHGYNVDVDVDHLLQFVETDIDEGIMDSFVNTYDVAGDEVDIGRYLAGEPENMATSSITKVMRTGRIISLYVNMVASAVVDSKQIIARGRAILTLMEAFKKKQHPMEVWIVIPLTNRASGNREKRCVVSVKVQDANQPVDDSRLMFTTAHPGLLRGLVFKYMDITSDADEKVANVWDVHHSHGIPDDIEDGDLVSDKEHSIVMPKLNYEDWTDDQFAAKWIERMLEMINQGAM